MVSDINTFTLIAEFCAMEDLTQKQDVAPVQPYKAPKLEVYGELRVVIKGAGSDVFDGATFSCGSGPGGNPGFC